MKQICKLIFSLFAPAFFLPLAGCGEVAPQEAVIRLDPRQRFQTISGWEATAQAGEAYSAAFDNYKDELLVRAADLGIDRLRLEIRSGAENPADFFTPFVEKKITEDEWREHYSEAINDNDDPFVIDPKGFQFAEIDWTIEKIVLPMKKLLAERGETLYVNLNFVDFPKGRGASNLRHDERPEEYAELMLAAFRHIKGKYGFAPDAIEVILEPDNKTAWTGEDIGKAIVATAKRLGDDGFRPEFIVPSTTNAANAPVFIDDVARVPGAMEHVAEFSYHRYCCASEAVLRRIAERADKYGKRTAMLEWIGADHRTLHEDLKLGRNSAWQQYTLAFPNQPDNGAQYFQLDDTDAARPQLAPGRRTPFLHQYFRYVRRGAVRIGANTNNAALDPLAFINTDGRYAVVVKSDAPGTVAVENLPAGVYGISYATAKQPAGGAPDVVLKTGETLRASIPDAGVLTVYGKSASPENRSSGK